MIIFLDDDKFASRLLDFANEYDGNEDKDDKDKSIPDNVNQILGMIKYNKPYLQQYLQSIRQNLLENPNEDADYIGNGLVEIDTLLQYLK